MATEAIISPTGFARTSRPAMIVPPRPFRHALAAVLLLALPLRAAAQPAEPDPFEAAAAAARAALAAGKVSSAQDGSGATAAATRRASATGDPIDEPTAEEVEDVIAEGERVDGHEIYDRLIKNRQRLGTVFQRGRIISEDPGGNPQQTNFWLYARDYRDADDNATGGVFTKSLFKITGPFEMRHTGYLYIERDDRDDEQFMYSPHRGRTSRVSLKGQSVAGTDFSFDDFLVSLDDIEDAEYERHDDEAVQGVECYVVEAFVKPESKTNYTRSKSYIEKEHYVALRTMHWNDVGVLSKEIVVPHGKIEEFDGAWIPTESTVTDLLEETSSTMYVDELEPNPSLNDEMFSLSQLSYRP
jgi:hypothetical protein